MEPSDANNPPAKPPSQTPDQGQQLSRDHSASPQVGVAASTPAALTSDSAEPEQPPAAPRDQLLSRAEQLGLHLPGDIRSDALLQTVEQRQKLIDALPTERLIEVAVWAGITSRGADKLELARRISQDRHTKFAGLSTDGLRALALLRGCQVEPDDDRETLRRKVKRQEGLFAKLRRKRRVLVAKVLGGMLGGGDAADPTLPEERRSRTFTERVEDEGLVSGIKSRLRGAADDYIREKLDEIEARIDHKLDQIDQRLAEWRDREIANRLKIIRITLFASVAVALLSLAYTWLRGQFPGRLP